MIVIKKDEALESVKNKAWYPPGCDNKDRHIDFLFKGCSEIDLVHCTDCRYWNPETYGCKRNPSVEAWFDSDFCSYGERREI